MSLFLQTNFLKGVEMRGRQRNQTCRVVAPIFPFVNGLCHPIRPLPSLLELHLGSPRILATRWSQFGHPQTCSCAPFTFCSKSGGSFWIRIMLSVKRTDYLLWIFLKGLFWQIPKNYLCFNNIIEAQFLVLKDIIVKRTKEYNIVALLEWLLVELEDHYKEKLF
jgi:hypothetical protein